MLEQLASSQLWGLLQRTCQTEVIRGWVKNSSVSTLDHSTCRHVYVTVEVDMNLSDNCRDVDILHKFPLVKKVFDTYSTSLPPRAAVERLQPMGQIFTPM